MPDATTFAELFGAVFPSESETQAGVVYGPLGDDREGNVVLPGVEDIRLGVASGPNGALLGTLIVSLAPVEIQGAPGSSLRLRPARDRRDPMLTLAAAVDHLLLLEEVNPGERRSVDRAVEAAKSAISTFASHSTGGFRYYESRAKIVVPGSFSLGTIEVQDGVFTFDGSLPDWASMGHVRIDRTTNRVYPVLLANGSQITVETLQDGTYDNVYLEQLFFALPPNFRRRGTMNDGNANYSIEDLSGSAFQSLADFYRWIGASELGRRFSAITIDQRFQGDMMVAIWPPYEDRRELNLFFERYPESLKYHRVSATNATVATVGTVATSSTAVFKPSQVGAALMIGINGDQEIVQPLSSTSLVETQRIIRYVSSETEVILDQALTEDVSGRAFYISDIVDVQPGIMSEAYLRLAEYELRRRSKGAKADQKWQEAIAAMHMAMADDHKAKAVTDQHRAGGTYQWGSVDVEPG